MTTTTVSGFQVHAIPSDVLRKVRDSGLDASGNPVRRITATGDEPLRCCLRDATAGEDVILFGYEPPIPTSPYREVGAVFAHAGACEGPAAGPAGGYPAAWRGHRQVLRAYDSRGWIHSATVHDGTDPEAAIAALFADPAVVQIHSRNVAYGCFMFRLTRPDGR